MTSPILHHGDALDVLRGMPSHSVDAIVTDPPYGLAFMGKRWDYDVPSVELWTECLRVAKPGGHLLAFAGTRTQHRMAVRIEDGGWEIRDMIAWVYGSGFPKSHNIGDGRGTALKPALEPITLARAPFRGTVADNVQRHGTGALNIDGCRVATDWNSDPTRRGWQGRKTANEGMFVSGVSADLSKPHALGRWPANLIHDGSDEVEAGFPQQANDSASRFFYCAKASRRERGEWNKHPTVKPLALMRYLVRLVTPPGGIVLDPFMGSGTTALACREEGFGFIGIEREAEYIETVRRRLAA